MQTECVMDLPFPPSVNRIWRQGKNGRNNVYLSAEYRAWIRQANMAVVVNGTWRKRVKMPGLFRALIQLDTGQRAGDVDNRIKAVLDWAQRSELIVDDKLCEEVTAKWVPSADAPRGCRLILRGAKA